MTLKSEYSQSLPKGFRGAGVSAGLKSSGAKDHGAQPGQLNLRGLARSNQVGAQQHADKSHHDEVVILVSAGRVGVGHVHDH